MSIQITEVPYNPKFLNAVKDITKINTNLVFKEYKDQVSIRAQSQGKEIIIDIKAPISGFNYKNGIIGIKDFPKFYSVYNVVSNPKIFLKEDISDSGTTEIDQVKSIIVEGDNTKIEFATHNPRLLGMSEKDELPPYQPEDTIEFDISEDMLKNIKQLSNALIEASAEKGTRLDIYKPEGSDTVKFRFKGTVATGNSFDKSFQCSGTTRSIGLNFDPLFFTWMPNYDYKIRVIDGPGKAKFIMAQTTVKDKDEEICTYSFIAGKLTSAFQQPD
jgi:hypothetical protein